jgi:hypothetical protein
MDEINEIQQMLMEQFQIKCLGEIKNYLGIEVEYDQKLGSGLKLSQQKYIESLACRYGIEESRSYKTPMEERLQLNLGEGGCTEYRSLIGSLLYLSMGTRPDIAYSVNYLSRFQEGATKTHFRYALRVLKYVYDTRSLKLSYGCDDSELVAYSDSDWAGDTSDRKSITGIVIFVFGCPVFWISRKQRSIVRNSCFAECLALADCIDEVRYIKELINDMNIKVGPATIFCDSSSARSLALNGNYSRRSKHIDIAVRYTFQHLKSNEIVLKKINTNCNTADIFTKSLGRKKFLYFRDKLCLM